MSSLEVDQLQQQQKATVVSQLSTMNKRISLQFPWTHQNWTKYVPWKYEVFAGISGSVDKLYESMNPPSTAWTVQAAACNMMEWQIFLTWLRPDLAPLKHRRQLSVVPPHVRPFMSSAYRLQTGNFGQNSPSYKAPIGWNRFHLTLRSYFCHVGKLDSHH